MRSAGLAIGGVVLVALGVAVAAGWVWPKKSEHTDTVDTAVRQVEIDNGSGDVIVRSADVSHTVVKQRFSYRGGDPERAFEVAGSTLLLHGCGSFCSVDYEVTVPVGTTVRGEVSSGDVVVEGTADVDVRASSGDVKLRLRDANNVSVEAKSGNVSADLDGVAKVDANTRSGSMDLDLKGVDVVRAEARSGDITVTVPEGEYRVEASTNSGDRNVRGDDPNADRVLELTTASGDITVSDS
ncbi:DUF4097 family beta strand repeat-containing protein [Saccharomonospora viridis]|jgi:hypothetical protein|uniref:DUF4097 family beta strand repeat-containing protein n=1 Tax=Saccharomonospora viridis TaxID=1852 RepID=UPI00059CAD99|nr:DUF4097 family beta strand repeat-containing protein [Saccharomonospora viridis]